MAEYIEKNYLLGFLDAVIETEEDQNKRLFAKAIKMTIGKMPPFNVKEWKTGYWFDKGSMSCRCSNCGCKSTKEYDFCPICGSDNRGGKNDKNI